MTSNPGSTSISLPAMGLGTWKTGRSEIADVVKAAIHMGYRHIDCASSYGTEKEIGEALAELMKQGTIGREELWITSKLSNSDHAPQDVQPALEKTLNDLGLDYLDLFLIHWPVAIAKGVWIPRKAAHMISLEELPLIDTWQAMEQLVAKGLVRHVGVSNFSVPKLKQLLEQADHGPEVNQVELHPYLQQPEMMDFCRSNDIKLMAYSPLGSADRPKPLKQKDEPVLLDDGIIQQIALEHRSTPAQIVLAWGMQRGTSVIPKSANPGRLKENLDSVYIQLDSTEMNAISELDRRRRYVDGSFYVVPDGPYSCAGIWDE